MKKAVRNATSAGIRNVETSVEIPPKSREMKISSKTGDDGKTFLPFAGKRVTKDHWCLGVLGSVDELNSFLGLAASFAKEKKLIKQLEKCQNDLFLLGAVLAAKDRKFSQERVVFLEETIADLEKDLPNLTTFLLPGGSKLSSLLHVCRTVARRAERDLVALRKKEKFDPMLLTYLNRLSDFLFLLARRANDEQHIKEKYPQI